MLNSTSFIRVYIYWGVQLLFELMGKILFTQKLITCIVALNKKYVLDLDLNITPDQTGSWGSPCWSDSIGFWHVKIYFSSSVLSIYYSLVFFNCFGIDFGKWLVFILDVVKHFVYIDDLLITGYNRYNRLSIVDWFI